MSFRAWHICVSGFTQTLRHPTGIEQLWASLRPLSSPEVCVATPVPWDADFEALAEFVRRNSGGLPSSIHVYAYSWGAGWGAMRFAEALRVHGFFIRHAVLCDAVYRSPHVLLGFRSLMNAVLPPRIVVPANVVEVDWCHQTLNKPAGHAVEAKDPEVTLVHGGVRIHGLGHSEMDESGWFQATAMWRAGVMTDEEWTAVTGGSSGRHAH